MQVMRCFVKMLRGLFAALFVFLEIRDGDVGFLGRVEREQS